MLYIIEYHIILTFYNIFLYLSSISLFYFHLKNIICFSWYLKIVTLIFERLLQKKIHRNISIYTIYFISDYEILFYV